MNHRSRLGGFVVGVIIAGLMMILLFLRETTTKMNMSRLLEERVLEKETENVLRMKSELFALERKEKELLAVKEETDLHRQIAEKKQQVANLEEEVASVQARWTEFSDKSENNTKERENVLRMTSELSELERKENLIKLLLSLKKEVDRNKQLAGKQQKEVAKLEGEVASLKANMIEISDKSEEMIKDKQLALRHRQRLEHLQNVCKSLPNNTFNKCEERAVKGNLYNVSHDIVYCAVEKSGSTFWRRILKVIEKGGKVKDPLNDIGLGAAYSLPSLKGVELHEIKEMMTQSGKRNVVFVRDPYTRLFSGWLDKFYATNPHWWGLGKTIIKSERINATNQSLECGHDVQFNEFVHFFAKDVKEKQCAVDGHFSPSYSHCLPCGLPYNFIGKYETLKEDTMYFLEKANLTQLVKFSDFETSSDEDAIKDSSKWTFQNREKVEKCMPFETGLRRVWKRLQSRGILHMKAVFPEKELSSNNITEPAFRKILLKAYQSFNFEDNLMNREIALKEAYSTVSSDTLYELHEAFGLDFKLFDYDKFPSFISNSR